MNLYLLKFNNYYNRQIKRYDALVNYLADEYLCVSNDISDQNPIIDINFIPNDGITAYPLPVNWNGEIPDYAVLAEGNEIISRWYVINSVKTSAGQNQLTLFRDTIADYYNEVMNAPMFIEKAYCTTDNSAIYNLENVNFNKIKTRETLLKDPTQSAWIVGYCDKAKDGTGESISFGGIPAVDYSVDVLEDWQFADFVDTRINMINNNSLYYGIKAESVIGDGSSVINNSYIIKFNKDAYIGRELLEDTSSYWKFSEANSSLLSRYRATSELEQAALVQIGYYNQPDEGVGNVLRLNDKYIKIGTGDNTKYYRIKVEHEAAEERVFIEQNTNAGQEFYNIINEGIQIDTSYRDIIYSTGGSLTPTYYIYYLRDSLKIILNEISFSTGFTETLRGDRPQLTDAPYCMFCIPYSEAFTFRKDGTTYTTNSLNSLSLGVGIATALGGAGSNSKIYDLQLLPYCPVPLVRNNGSFLDLDDSDISESIIYDLYETSGSLVLWAKESTGSFNIEYKVKAIEDPLRFKVNQQTRYDRLCSPNYDGVFEFTSARNKGIDYINVDYTYKPYQPYIHLNPNFKGLYGSDFDDARGLICGGSFSLPITTDAWISYEINNKNYLNAFNKQIEYLELQNKYADVQGIANAITGTAGATLTGALIGGPMGALFGGALSGAAGLSDSIANRALREANIDYTKDLFAMNNENIQALPTSLGRVSAYNANNKIFPFIETYLATDSEISAFTQKLIYNGFTIDRLGTLAEYYIQKPSNITWGYFKGQLIRCEDIDEDFHVINTISEELSKGVFLI